MYIDGNRFGENVKENTDRFGHRWIGCRGNLAQRERNCSSCYASKSQMRRGRDAADASLR